MSNATATMNSTASNERELIELVFSFPVLYDERNPDSRNREVKSRCWNEIAEGLNDNSKIYKHVVHSFQPVQPTRFSAYW